MRDSCSSRESHKSSLSQRSSADDAVVVETRETRDPTSRRHVSTYSSTDDAIMETREMTSRRHVSTYSSADDAVMVETREPTSRRPDLDTPDTCPPTVRMSQSRESQPGHGALKQKYCHVRTPSGDKTDKFGTIKHVDNGRTSSGAISSRGHSTSHKSGEEFSSEESRTPKSRGSGSFIGSGSGTTDELRLCKHELISSSPEDRDREKRSSNIYPSMSRIEKVLGKDVSDEPVDFRALRQDIRQLEKETIRRRQEIVRPNGGEIWAELKGGVLSSGGDSVLSPAPAYRSLRSLTPDDADDSTSFHESFEKELIRRRRTRRRSASCSSRCCESDQCCRLDSGQSRSTHSVTGASSRNSSSRSEKSSTRSSRSPSIEKIKQGLRKMI